VAVLLNGCATPQPVIPEPLAVGKAEAGAAAPGVPRMREQLTTGVAETPKPPPPTKLSTVREAPPAPAKPEEANITLMFDQLPLPTFIQVVYGTILKKNFTIDPKVAERKDLVTIRAAQPQTPSQVADAARMLLKSYGIAVLDLGGGFYRIVPDTAQTGYAPEIRRGRALPEVPLPLRPIFQLVELQAVRSSDVAGWMKIIFGQKVTVQDDPNRNALLLSGQSDDVMAALEAIHVLDQPLMKGRQSTRINPVFWSAEELAKKLGEVLQAEGYGVATAAGISNQFPLTILPIQAINAIIIFSGDPAIMAHAVEWAKQLDRPSAAGGAGSSYFTYQARYTDAQALAKTMQDLLAGAAVTAPAPGAPAPAAPAKRPSRVVVNPATNTLIFQGNTEDYTQLLNLLQELDKPAKAALIEVTVAEVTLTDKTQLGVEWAFEASGARGYTITGGTLGGLGIGNGGLTIRGLNSAGDVRLILNALATDNRANILSSPRLLARNGETAMIQVGEEVPIITSQQTSPTTGGTGSILQSVQYKSTGVILKVKPIIHAGDRVELEVAQEVSNAQTTTTGVSSSPTFSTRKVETRLSLKDGSTVLLGGLIRNNQERTESGVPLLKEIPGVGQLFRNNTDTNSKTELLVLITPYIVADDHDAQAITDAFRKQLGSWAHPKVVQGREPVNGGESAPTKPAPVPEAPPAPQPSAPQSPSDGASVAEPVLQKADGPPANQPPPALPVGNKPAAEAGAPGAGVVVTDPRILEEIRAAMAADKTRKTPAPKPAGKAKPGN
jgi:general secretion pathway protein D